MSKNVFFCLALVELFCFISTTVSDKNLKQYETRSVGSDYSELPQNEDSLKTQAEIQAYQIMAESRRRKGQLQNSDIKTETNKLNSTFTYDTNWPTSTRKLGAVSAVTFDPNGNVVIFQRGDRIWNANTFLLSNVFTQRDLGAITDNTIIAFNRTTGGVVYEWGKDLFYMPHGLTIDADYNVWITDVALHQVMKFSSSNYVIDKHALLVLGTAFKPGNSKNTFCKPTSVTVLPDGDFFVADGYCNSRIIKYSKAGDRIMVWGENSFQGKPIPIAPKNFFAIPHGLTLALDKGLVCVADRENGRVQCFHASNGTFHSQYHSPIIGDRLFSVSYSPVNGGQLYVVNGPVDTTYHEVLGFVIDMATSNVIAKFGPNNSTFSNPHDLVVSSDGTEVYVAELDPDKIHKFILTTSIVEKQNSTNAKPTITLDESLTPASPKSAINKDEKGSTALLIVALFAVLIVIGFGAMLLISRRRKRGCMPFGIQNRRHAWDFPSVKQDGFKLGNLLDRKRGFEKLNQDASDEEPNVNTNMLNGQQFA